MAVSVLRDREQHERRRSMQKQDKFGRIWHCSIDVHDPNSGHCGIPSLDGKYHPPIDIPLKYLKKVDPKNVFRMDINFALWKSDWRERMAGYRDRLQYLAEDMYGEEYGEKLENPPRELLRKAGPLPIPLEFIEACEVGNKWALGIPKEDGTYYPRPKWATDDLWEQYQLLRQSGYWRAGDDTGFAAADPAKYPDEDEGELTPKKKKAPAADAA